MTFPEASRQYKQNKKLYRTAEWLRPFPPHKYHPKHSQYTPAQPYMQTQPSSRQKHGYLQLGGAG